MSACEYCWGMSRLMNIEYQDALQIAEREHWACTTDTLQGRILRAGQFWDEEGQRDRRDDIGER